MKQRFKLWGKRGAAVSALLLLSLLAAFPRQAHALFGIADLVWDPTNFAEAVSILSQDVSTFQKVVEEVEWATKTYNQAVTQYDLIMAQAKNFDAMTKSGWRTAIPQLVNNATPNRFGETALWGATLNGSPALAPQAWQTATFAVAHPNYLQNLQPGASAPLASLASMHAVDGASTQCMQTVGQYSQNSNANQASVIGLQTAAADDTAATNSQVEQLNLLNAGNAQTANELRAHNMLSSCIAQQQMIANKIQRDQIADHLNFVGEVSDRNQVADLAWGNSAATITNYRPQ